jgi:hypothetical protein
VFVKVGRLKALSGLKHLDVRERELQRLLGNEQEIANLHVPSIVHRLLEVVHTLDRFQSSGSAENAGESPA